MHPSDIALLRYADGAHSKETAEHLAACPECRSVVQDSRQISAALRSLPVPPPPRTPALPPPLPLSLGHIAPARQNRRQAIAATLVAGMLIGGTATYVGQSEVAFAGVLSAVDRPMLASAAHPMGPGRWTYLSRVYEDSVLWALPRLETVTVDSSAGKWIIVTTTPEGERASLSVDQRNLAPISGSWDLADRVHETEQYTRDSTIVTITGYSRSRRRAYPVGDSIHARMVNREELRLFFRTQPLDRHWRQSVRLLQDSARTADLAVSGRRTIETPVGRCDCWQVEMAVGRRRSVMWVRADDGVVVKTEDSYGIAELVAEDPLTD